MKTLYILNNPSLYQQCQNAMAADDGLLLIENAVVLANQAAVKHGYVLEEDLIARGLSTDSSWKVKDYDGFVDLTLDYDKTVSWL